METLGQILILIGSVFSLLGALGILRMPDIYNRLQAGTKATTLGALSLILGVGLLNPAFLGKSILLIVFIVLTNPISSSTIARSGRRAGVPMVKEAVVDAYAEKLGQADPHSAHSADQEGDTEELTSHKSSADSDSASETDESAVKEGGV